MLFIFKAEKKNYENSSTRTRDIAYASSLLCSLSRFYKPIQICPQKRPKRCQYMCDGGGVVFVLFLFLLLAGIDNQSEQWHLKIACCEQKKGTHWGKKKSWIHTIDNVFEQTRIWEAYSSVASILCICRYTIHRVRVVTQKMLQIIYIFYKYVYR